VRAGDREFLVTVVEQAAAEYGGIDLKIFSPQAGLDDDFPDGSG